MRALKIASIVVGSLLALVILALVSVLVFVDPNDYRDQIAAAVEKNTGRKLELPGELGLSIFPWLALSVGEARLGESPGFGTEPFVAIKEAKLGLRLWPLLHGDLEVGNVRLAGMRVRLITDEQGRNNWDDLTAKQKENKPEESAGGPVKLPTIEGLEIVDAAVLLEDRQAKTRQELRKFDLKVSRFVSGQSVTLASAFELVASPQMQLAVKLDSKLTADLERNNFLLAEPNIAVTLTGADYPKDGVPVNLKAKSIALDLPTQRHTVDALDLSLTWKGQGLPAAGVPVSVKARSIAADLATKRHTVDAFELNTNWQGAGFPAAGVPVKLTIQQIGADLEAQTAKLTALDMNLAGASIAANLSGKQILDAPQLLGRLELKPVVLRELAPKLGVTLPVTRAADTFKRFGFSGDVVLTKASADFKAFTMVLDETTAKGSFGVADFASKALRFDLNVDRLDADRYRPPEAPPETAPAPASTDKAAPTDIPVGAIRSLNARGELNVGQAIFAGMKFSNLRLGLNARDGIVRLDPTAAGLYGGQYNGEVSLDAKTEVPRVDMDLRVAGVNFAPLFQDFFETKRVAGIGTTNIKVTAAGKNTDDLLKALNGTVDFGVKDGALEGADFMYEIRRARAVFRQQPIPARAAGPERTAFSSLAGTGVITNGVLTNKDLDVATEFLRVTGAGKVDLVRSNIDYKLNALVLRLPKEGADAAATQELVDAKIPATVTGSLSAPKIGLDLKGMVKEQLKQEYKEKYKEKVDEKKEKVEKKLRDKLDEKLKGIFGGS